MHKCDCCGRSSPHETPYCAMCGFNRIAGRKTARDETIWVENISASTTMEPFVVIHWDDRRAQMTPEQAVLHAMTIIDVAQASVSESLLLRFLEERLALEMPTVVRILADFRKYRHDREGEYRKGFESIQHEERPK